MKEILRRRQEAQLLRSTAFTRPADVVAWFGAVQAQDYAGALWAVGLRMARAREQDVEQAIADRSIVRSWPMRGTLHLLAAADARWMIDLLAPRAAAAAANRLRAMGLDERVLSRARRTLVEHLEGGRRLTRPAAYGVLERAGIPTGGQRGLHVLWRLAHDGLLCLGPRDGKQHTVVLLEEWLPRARPLPRDEALAELACRYFTSHGPATLRDFAWWSGMTLGDARAATALAGARVVEETLAGERHWSGASAAPAGGGRTGERGHALPAFDEFLVAYADRSAAVDPAYARRVTAFDVLGPVVIVDGRIVARWKRRTAARGEVVLSTSPLAAPRGFEAATVKRALGRYARFAGIRGTAHAG